MTDTDKLQEPSAPDDHPGEEPVMTRMMRFHSEEDERRGMPRLLLIAFICLGIVFAWAGWNIYAILAEDAAQEKTSAKMREFVSVGGDGSLPGPPDVDFSGLLESAPNTCGWIRIPGTDIDYPVMRADDNTFYLTHAPDGSVNRAGSIFMDSWNTPDFRDRNTIIYGHRMNNGSMFAQLHRYREKTFLDAYPYIYLTLPDGRKTTWEIFSVQTAAVFQDGEPYRLGFTSDEEFEDWLQTPRESLLCGRNVTLTASDRILTLSTCVKGESERRLVVQARQLPDDGAAAPEDERRKENT